MWRGLPTGVFFLVAASVLAGCTEEAKPQVGPGGDMESDPGMGSITGSVVDDTQLPVADVVVALADQVNNSAVTGTDGAFRLINIPLGGHSVLATKAGYTSALTPVILTEAEPSREVEIRMQAIAAPVEGYHEVIPGEAFISCSATTSPYDITFTQPCGFDANNRPVFYFSVNASKGLVAVMIEMTWVQSFGFSAEELRVGLWKNPTCGPTRCDAEGNIVFRHDDGREYVQGPPALRWWNGTLEKPFQDNLDLSQETRLGAAALIKTPATVNQDPTDHSLVFQQPVEFWVTVFYHEEPAQDYTALAAA